MELPVGTVLEERYTVLAPVKSGGMGAVYRVQDARLAGGICALKQMHDPSSLGSQASIVQYRFNEEMQVLCSLRHQGLPRVMDFFRYGGSWCIVMDFIEGENLQQMRKARPLSQEFVVSMGIEVLDILVYLHQMSPPIIHRDIKPANIIVEKSTTHVKLVDFGLARMVDLESDLEQTMVGTPGYAPPEQLHGRAEPRSDLYSLGATMGSLLCGLLPGAFVQVGIRELLPDLNADLADAIDKSLHYYSADRFADAAGMRAALLAVQQQLANRDVPSFVDGPSTEVVRGHRAAGEEEETRERILIVDDDIIVRTVVEEVLQ
ncbi:MAG TPA: serine/threonine-protein kinase [Candidatus Xenobia bacterium]